MKRAYMWFVMLLVLQGCSAALWGNIAVLAVTLGVFFGTLSLGHRRAEGSHSAERSGSSSHR